MHTFFGIVRYEYRMSVLRWGLWIGSLLAAALYFLSFDLSGGGEPIDVWEAGGGAALLVNFLLPVVAGIMTADRLPRDSLLGVWELLRATPASRTTHLFGKYVGALLATLTPPLFFLAVGTGLAIFLGAPVAIAGTTLLAFLAIIVPAHVFVDAFSLACPALIPVRIYQVLLTGYWFWGNFLNPAVVPNTSDTPLTPVGKYALSGFFRGTFGGQRDAYTPAEATLSVALLCVTALLPLLALDRYMAWQARRA